MPSEIAKPYWQDGWSAGLPEISLPTSVDVLIVGAGYTGLSAARETAKAGAATLVLDAAAIGACLLYTSRCV